MNTYISCHCKPTDTLRTDVLDEDYAFVEIAGSVTLNFTDTATIRRLAAKLDELAVSMETVNEKAAA